MKIYTKTGDKGTTQLIGGQRVSKSNLRIHTYGDVDELNSFLGLALSYTDASGVDLHSQIQKIQNLLFNMGSILACIDLEKHNTLPKIKEADISEIETWIDLIQSELPAIKNFILPGGHISASHFHVCRTVCRRVERQVQKLVDNGDEIPENILIFLNRLSDYLFCVARYCNFKNKISDIYWNKDL